MTQRVEGGQTYTQVFDAENRLVSVTAAGSQTTEFIYDGDGNMIKKINPDGSKTIYVGGLYEVDKSSGGSVTRTVTYYPAGGAMRVDGTLYFGLKDHLGSASVVTDASGDVVGEQRYNPYGETRLTTGSMFTDKLFTGQREMAGLGIYHYGARFYSPKLARFISADTIVPGGANPQAFNRYSYVLNNPINYTDPSGHCYVSGHWMSNDSSACEWASANQGSLSGNGNGGFVGNGGGGTGGGGCNTLACISNNGGLGANVGTNIGGPNIFVPVVDTGGPNIFVPVVDTGGPNIFVPVVGTGGPNIFVPVFDQDWIDIFVPLSPEDIWQIFTESPEDILMPGGSLIGISEENERIRTIENAEELQEIFNALTVDATPFTPDAPYSGTIYELPDGGTVGLRDSVKYGPTIDIDIPGIPIDKLHLPK